MNNMRTLFSVEMYLETKKVVAQTNRILRRKKKESFKKNCKSTDGNTSVKKVLSVA